MILRNRPFLSVPNLSSHQPARQSLRPWGYAQPGPITHWKDQGLRLASLSQVPAHKVPPDPRGPTRPHQAPPGPTRPHQAPRGPTRPHQAPLGPIRPHQAPPGPSRPHQAPPGPSRPHQAPLGPTRPIQAPPGPTRPHQAPPGPSRSCQMPPDPGRDQAAPHSRAHPRLRTKPTAGLTQGGAGELVPVKDAACTSQSEGSLSPARSTLCAALTVLHGPGYV